MKRFFLFFLAFILVFTEVSMGVMAETTNEQTVAVSDQTVTTHGRTYYQDGFLWFNWTYSGFSFSFYGTAAKGVFRSGEHNGAYLNVYVDGSLVPVNTVILKGGTAGRTVTLVEGLEEGEHTVTVRKRTENRSNATAGVSQLVINGTLCETLPQKSTKTIEVIGDSITCGFGNLMDGTKTKGYQAKGQDGTLTYATLAGTRFDAEISVIGKSGIGFQYNGGGSTVDTMMDAYEDTDYFRIPGTKWDFSQNPSDVVIIALGTNDTSAPGKEAYFQGAKNFLKKVRKNNPDAIIIWVYEVITASYSEQLKQVVIDANFEGDDKVYYHALGMIDQEADGIGLDGHPSLTTHKKDAEGLANLIAEVTGWEMGQENPCVSVTLKPNSNLTWNGGVLTLPASYCKKPLAELEKELLTDDLQFQNEKGEKAEDCLLTGLRAVITKGSFTVGQCVIGIRGDVDENGTIDAKDALEVLKFSVNKVQLSDAQKTAASVTGEEKISAKDALDILKYSVGKIDAFREE